jgi:hypothetical protein
LRQGKGDLSWLLSEPERLLLWLPLVVEWSMKAIASLRRG